MPVAPAVFLEKGKEGKEGKKRRAQKRLCIIFLVEDDDMVRRTAVRMLKEAGHTVLGKHSVIPGRRVGEGTQQRQRRRRIVGVGVFIPPTAAG